jgi:hypothetical protein
MQELNLCRQFAKDFFNGRGLAPVKLAYQSEHIRHPRDLEGAVKFYVPNDGISLEDPKLAGIIDSEIHLPFPKVALEYIRKDGDDIDYTVKHILLVEEEETIITVKTLIKRGTDLTWLPFPAFAVNKIGWNKGFSSNGLPNLEILSTIPLALNKEKLRVFILDQMYCLLSFLNALSCSNVGHTKIRNSYDGKQKKGALPFDDYHILTLRQREAGRFDSGIRHLDRHSPREHLRRGHVRHYPSGVKLWIEAVLVNAGTEGSINKTYKI